MADAFQEGIQLFNSRKFFECHEVLETLWLKAQGDEKVFLQGIIQVAAAFHHLGRGNIAGTLSLLEEGCNKLAKFRDASRGLDLAGFLKQIGFWQHFLNGQRPTEASDLAQPALPQIEHVDEC